MKWKLTIFEVADLHLHMTNLQTGEVSGLIHVLDNCILS